MTLAKHRGIQGTLFLLTAVCSLTAAAQAQYGGGTGEPDNPYQIWTPEQMNAIGTEPNDWDKHFKLRADIDLSQYEGTAFNIIGFDPNRPFTGTFDGSNHAISNFCYHVPYADNVGLFGVVADPNARIENLTLVAPSLEVGCGMRSGSLVAHLREGTLINCHARDATIRAVWFVGGLVGENGYIEPSPGTLRTSASIINCSYEGIVYGSFTEVGGLVGNECDGEIRNCYTAGEVTSEYDVGGLVGDTYSTTIVSCYSTSAVTGASQVGGLVGGSFTGSVVQCYATGPVTGDEDVAGLIWDTHGNSTAVRASFWDVETSGQTASSGGQGRTRAEMQNPETFIDAGWDFVGPADGPSDIWAQPTDGGYPILWWQLAEAPELPFAGGTGSADDPYLIETPEQLNSIGHNPRFMAADLRMSDDINLQGVTFFPIGNTEYPFTGVFDGGSHAVSNFTLTSTEFQDVGLFRDILGSEAEVRNLVLIDPNVTAPATYGAGALVGALGKGTLRNCHIKGGHITGETGVGALIGLNGIWDLEQRYMQGHIIDCSAEASVQGIEMVGGLAGINGWLGYIANSSFAGNVTGLRDVGGLVGASVSATIVNSSAAGRVSGEWSVGGLVADNSYGSMERCCSTASVSGHECAGGLAGTNRGAIADCYSTGDVTGGDTAGGLVGWNGLASLWSEYDGTITNCYAAGAVSGDVRIGGLIGLHHLGLVHASFWDIDTSGLTASAAGTGKTTAQMQTAGTFLDAGWDLTGETENGREDIWWILEGQDYPRLWWEPADEL